MGCIPNEEEADKYNNFIEELKIYQPHLKYGRLKPWQQRANEHYPYELYRKGLTNRLLEEINSNVIEREPIISELLPKLIIEENEALIQWFLQKKPLQLYKSFNAALLKNRYDLADKIIELGFDINSHTDIQFPFYTHIQELCNAFEEELETKIIIKRLEYLVKNGFNPYSPTPHYRQSTAYFCNSIEDWDKRKKAHETISQVLKLGTFGLFTKTDIDNVEYVDNCKIGQSFYLVSGFTFKVKNYDGYTTNAFLHYFDKGLNLVWTVELEEANTSKINRIEIFEDKIYIVVTHGKSNRTTSDLYVYLYIISMEGHILEKIKISNSYYNPTPICVVDRKIYFAHSKLDGTIYRAKSKIPTNELVEYHIDTKEIKTFVFNQKPKMLLFTKFKNLLVGLKLLSIGKLGSPSVSYMTEQILHQGSTFFVFGRYIEGSKHLTYILSYNKNTIKKQILASMKHEYFLGAFVADNMVIVFSTFPGVYGDNEKYLRITHSSFDNTILKEKKIYYKEFGWKDFHFGEKLVENEKIWLKIKNENDEKYYYAQFDKDGNLLARITSATNSLDKFYSIKNNFQVEINLQTLTIDNYEIETIIN